ncbi:ATP-binding cassette domain-containing protein [Vibrio crassostreae]|uniref:ATP-binding cassette domain-containing protein n=1 Tax=Vibrio crassostreae TaxID=246167 RepID=UPI002E17CDBC|nr:ATP-binding cassette domain-containing protein [Vibrio crassostreae]
MNNDFPKLIYNYCQSQGYKPKKEMISSNSEDIITQFSDFFTNELFSYSLVAIDISRNEILPESIIHLDSSGRYYFSVVRNNIVVSSWDDSGEIDRTTIQSAYYIKKSLKPKQAGELKNGIYSMIPKLALSYSFLVVFALLTPLYSNVFNSKIIHTEGYSTLFVVSLLFIMILVIEYGIRSHIKSRVFKKISFNVSLLGDAFSVFYSKSKVSNISSKIRTIETACLSIWENYPQIFVDVIFVFSFSLFIAMSLSYFSIILFMYYLVFFAVGVYLRFNHYKLMLEKNNISVEKGLFFHSLDKNSDQLPYFNVHSFVNLLKVRCLKDEYFRKKIDEESFKWGELTKVNGFLSIVFLFISSLLAVRFLGFPIHHLIALMLVNGRLSSIVISLINRSYQVKLQSYHFIQASEQIYKNFKGEGGVELSSINEIKVEQLKKSELMRSIGTTLNLDFKKGNMYAVVGASGSGKTTLLKILAGVDRDYSGNVKFNNYSIEDISDYSMGNRVSLSLSSDSLMKCSLRENFALSGIYDVALIRDICEKCCPNLELNSENIDILDADLLPLSSGERQRLVINMKLNKGADVILLDEPTSFLSKKDSIEFVNDLRDRYRNSIIIISTHCEHILSYFDKCIDLENKSGIKRVVVNV